MVLFSEVWGYLLRLWGKEEVGDLERIWRGRDERNRRIKNGFIGWERYTGEKLIVIFGLILPLSLSCYLRDCLLACFFIEKLDLVFHWTI